MTQEHIAWFADLSINEVAQVGGKNASLGEMINHLHQVGVRVPNGFATTADSYRQFIQQKGLGDKIQACLDTLNVDDVRALAEAGQQIRQWIIETPLLPQQIDAISNAWRTLQSDCPQGEYAVAVRSSATAEDLPDASFAGQQETYLNVRGLDSVLHAVKHVYASLYNDRAISYRVHHGFAHDVVAISAGIQRMVRSETAASGVMFTLDTESGFNDAIFITAGYGLGELVVQGAINPDEYYLYKPNLRVDKPAILRRHLGTKAHKMIYASGDDLTAQVATVDVEVVAQRQFCLNDDDLTSLGQQALLIEKHYGRPMDIEWAKDGDDGLIYIVQARPETVKSRENKQSLERYQIKQRGKVLSTGRSIGQRIGQGKACVVANISEMERVQAGQVLVTDMTDPDWEPIMKRASAIVTNRGGRTCHAAIIARELGIPAVVGCGDATKMIADGDEVTVSCAEGDEGYVYQGLLVFEHTHIDVERMPDIPVKVMMNVGNPERAFAFQALPNAGVGLARVEFIISQTIGIHPQAILNVDTLEPKLQAEIRRRTAAYASPVEYYVAKLAEGIATLGAAFAPKRVIVRLSDFKSNEYANLLGGSEYEPKEENPMIGFRGAARYIAAHFQECFKLECEAVKRVRDDMGLTNIEIMIPFVRTVQEAQAVEIILAENGLKRGKNGLRLIMMCEVPSNALLADEFLQYFDGFSIGSNDLTQLTLGLDRDSGLVASQFDERNAAVKVLLELAIKACKKVDKYIGICGQGPSDHPDLAHWLMDQGIDSLSLNPDTVLETWLFLSK